MLPRSQSIFHLGEERGAPCHRRNLVGAPTMISGGTSRRLREGVIVGLQILVHHRHQHHGSSGGHQYHQQHGRHVPAPANIVLKQMVGPPPRAAAERHGAVSCSFLKACSLCQRELSPNKDVYMYRGDHGFCSEECRWRQILVDEARERDAIGKERRGLAHHQHHHSPHRTPIHGWPRKTLLAEVA